MYLDTDKKNFDSSCVFKVAIKKKTLKESLITSMSQHS